MAGDARALFLDWGGTLARTREHRTLVVARPYPLQTQSGRRPERFTHLSPFTMASVVAFIWFR